MFRLFFIALLVLCSHASLANNANAQISRAWDRVPPGYTELRQIEPPKAGESFSVPDVFEVESGAVIAIAGAGASGSDGFVEIVAYEYDVRTMKRGREVARDRAEWNSQADTPVPAIIVLRPERRTQYQIMSEAGQSGYRVRGFIPK